MSRWWRAYDDAVDDPKVQRLPGELFKAWFNILCICSAFGGRLPPIKDVAFRLRIQERKATRIISELEVAGLLDRDQDIVKPHNWENRQYQSDVSTDRVQAFRKRQRNVSVTPNETAPDTETDNRTDVEAKKPLHKRGIPLPGDWKPSEEERAYAASKGFSAQRIDLEAERFRNHAAARGRLQKDWHAAWRNWVISPLQMNGHRSGSKEDRQERLANVLQTLDPRIRPYPDDRSSSESSGASVAGFLPLRESH